MSLNISAIKKSLAKTLVLVMVLANIGLNAPVAQAATVVHDDAGDFSGTHSNTEYSVRDGDGSSSVHLTGGSDYDTTSNTKLLLEFEGPDNSTTDADFVDSSPSSHAVNQVGNAKLETSQKKYGSSSAQFDGTADYVQAADSSDWSFGTGNWTIDMWVRLTSKPSNSYMVLSSQRNSGSAPRFIMHLDNRTAQNRKGLTFFNDTSPNGLISEGAFSLDSYSLNTWYHLAVVRSGSTLYLFRDGDLKNTASTSYTHGDYNGALNVGGDGFEPDFPGYIDNFRVTKGEALWTSNFTPPSTDITYDASGTYTSDVIDSGELSAWSSFAVTDDTPANTTLTYDTRSGDTASPDGSWSSWEAVSGTTVASPSARYIQYRANLATSDTSASPALYDVTLTYGPAESWRWRNDDGSEADATWAEGQATALTGLDKGVTKRLRFGLSNSGSESEFVRQSTATLQAGENAPFVSAYDPSAGHAYIGTYQSPAKVVKVNVADNTRLASLDLVAGEDNLTSAVIDSTNGYAYFGTYTSPGKVVKIRLSDFSKVGTLTLNTGEDYLKAATIDVSGGYAYFGTWTTPAKVIKVRLSDFAREAVIDLDANEKSLRSAVTDANGGYAYFGTSDSYVVKIQLSNFSRIGRIDTGAAAALSTAVIDPSGGFAYFGSEGNPAKIGKVNLSSFGLDDSLTLDTGEESLNSSVIDTVNGFGYFGTVTSYAKVIKVRLSDMVRISAITDDAAGGGVRSAYFDSAAGYAYFVNTSTPARIDRISVAPKVTPRLEYAVKSGGSCAASSGWAVPASSGTSWLLADSSYLTSGSATTNVSAGITDGNTTFNAGQALDVSATGSEISMGESQFSEVEWAVEAGPTAQDGATYCFRATDAGSILANDPGYAEATLNSSYTPTINQKLTLSRHSTNADSDVALEFDLNGSVSTPLTVTFPSGFTVTQAFTSGTCSGGGTIDNFAYTANTLTADKSSCSGTVSLSGASVTLPSAAGLYTVTWTNDDPGETVVPVTDDDHVDVSANVDPTLTFDIDIGKLSTDDNGSDYAIDFGQVGFATPESSDNTTYDSIWLDFETNATGGGIISVRSANAAMKSQSTSDQWSSSTASLAANTERYGICVDTTIAGTPRSGHPGGTSWLAASPYDTSCTAGATMAVGALQTSDQTVMAAAGPLDAGRVQVRVGMSVASSTPAHPDYRDVLTFTAVSTY